MAVLPVANVSNRFAVCLLTTAGIDGRARWPYDLEGNHRHPSASSNYSPKGTPSGYWIGTRYARDWPLP